MTVTEQPATAAPTRLVLPGHRYRLGRVSVTQIVVVQLAALAAIAAYPAPDAVFLPVLGAALLVVAAMFVRRGRRWWYEEVAQRWWYRRRARRHGRAGAERMAFLTPWLAFHDATDRGTRMGVGIDHKGWYAAMVVTPLTRPGAASEPEPGPDLDRMLAELARTTPAASALQLVHHVVPAPTVMSSAGQWTWVAVRITTPEAPAEAASRGGGLEGVERTLAAATGRMIKALRVAGAESRVLISDELADVLATVGGWEPNEAVAGRAMPEHWTAWYGTEGAHVCFRLSGAAALNSLVAVLDRTSALSATLSVRFEPDSHAGGVPDRTPTMHGLLRICAGVDLVDATVNEVVAAARRAGVTLHRLDGVHAPALYAVAPTAQALRH